MACIVAYVTISYPQKDAKMEKVVFSLVVLVMGFWNVAGASCVNWFTDYSEALEQAREYDKPLVVFFTGSDWCEWCVKMDDEVFESGDFVANSGDGFVFVKIDFPMNVCTPNDVIERNKALKDHYNVVSFPTVLLLANDGRQIAMTGYFSGGAEPYSEFLSENVGNYKMLKDVVVHLEDRVQVVAELEKLYRKAREMHLSEYAVKILDKGLESEENTFFLSEQYRLLVEGGKLIDKETLSLRKQLLAIDDCNANDIHYRIAVIDFQELYGNDDCKVAIDPLVKYLDRFGNSDSNNSWRVRMTIAQFLYDRSYTGEALKYAQSGYEMAPQDVKEQIGQAIEHMKGYSIETAVASILETQVGDNAIYQH